MAMTYVDALNVAIEALDGEVAEKLTALREQVARKRTSSKPTKTQIENEAVKTEILHVLAEAYEPMTCGEVNKALEGGYNPQKISALLRQLIAGGKVVKSTEKKVSRFELA